MDRPTDVRREDRTPPGEHLLATLARAVRARRKAQGLTLRELSARSGVSQRFLVQMERGDGNVSVARLADVADALETTAAALLAEGEHPAPAKRVVALIGLRGAGKTAIGGRAAKQLGVPFVELDALVEEAAGMRLAALFELHGEPYYRKLERDTLRAFFDRTSGAVLATGGSLVQDPETYALLRRRATTVWLRAKPEDHMRRVVEQGDARPMANRVNAMAELRALLRAREPLYAQADVVVDTSAEPLRAAVADVVKAAGG